MIHFDTFNRPFSHSRYWAGTSLQLKLMQGVFSNAVDINRFFMIFPRLSLHSMLVQVHYREYENGLFCSINGDIFLRC